jgi:hypothetical protein
MNFIQILVEVQAIVEVQAKGRKDEAIAKSSSALNILLEAGRAID